MGMGKTDFSVISIFRIKELSAADLIKVFIEKEMDKNKYNQSDSFDGKESIRTSTFVFRELLPIGKYPSGSSKARI